MAERFEPYHVPQQSRRDKLRVLGQNHHQGCIDNMVSFHDPSLLASDLLTSSSNDNSVKNESHVNLMGYQQHMYTDPRNPSTILDNYTQQGGARFLDQSFHGGRGGGGGVDVVVYRPEAVSESATRTTTGQGLSLSLSSSNVHQRNLPRYDSSEMVNSGGRYIVSDVNGGGPFTGYASVLKGSRFLKPAHQLMEELCDVGKGIYVEKFVSPDTTLMDPPPLMEGNGVLLDDPESCSDGSDHSRRKSKLISMLHEVYRRYKQYYQQMQAVIASFESAAGLSNAAPFANSAFRSMSKHFKTLKNALIDQLQFITKSHFDNDEITRFGNSGRGNFGQRSCGVVDHQQPVWRPQRGLPERAVSVLKSWLFDHFLHPYPTDTDKLMLAKQTGLSRNQVSNWFINARVRLWKPMVEEIHMLETQEAQKASQRKDQSAPRINENKGLASENLSASTSKGSDFPSKRTRNNTGGDNYGGGEMNLSYDNFAHHSHPAIGANVVSGNNGVQLTLGLHQNNGISLSDRFPLTSALTSTQRFGFVNDGYVLGGYEGQNCQFRRNIVEGQLMHDFVG